MQKMSLFPFLRSAPFRIMRAGASDVFRPCPRHYDIRFPDPSERRMNGNGDRREMHADQCVPDIHAESSTGTQIFYHDRVFKFSVNLRHKCAARMKPGFHADLLKAVFLHACPADAQRAVDVFAPLRRKKDPCLIQRGKNAFEKGSRNVGT